MIYITGDTHGSIDIGKLSFRNWWKSKELTANDFLIIAGDFGLLFDPEPSKESLYWIEWLDSKPWTTLFVDGNHENFDLIYQKPIIDMFGGKVGLISKKILHLKRGEIYTIDGRSVFTFGGATSIDKGYRIAGRSWWEQEEPSFHECNYALDNIAKHNKFDIVITHDAPISAINAINTRLRNGLIQTQFVPDSTSRFLEEVKKKIEYKAWYCGHFHEDIIFENDPAIGNFRFLYHDIIQI